mmetsp:Transcript_65218/g.168353  ORF Transcript_65218/g.168353 Transcript_65218/m.168353 type:complete len:339 (-) Transcript_65218:83-1099(-)
MPIQGLSLDATTFAAATLGLDPPEVHLAVSRHGEHHGLHAAEDVGATADDDEDGPGTLVRRQVGAPQAAALVADERVQGRLEPHVILRSIHVARRRPQLAASHRRDYPLTRARIIAQANSGPDVEQPAVRFFASGRGFRPARVSAAVVEDERFQLAQTGAGGEDVISLLDPRLGEKSLRNTLAVGPQADQDAGDTAARGSRVGVVTGRGCQHLGHVPAARLSCGARTIALAVDLVDARRCLQLATSAEGALPRGRPGPPRAVAVLPSDGGQHELFRLRLVESRERGNILLVSRRRIMTCLGGPAAALRACAACRPHGRAFDPGPRLLGRGRSLGGPRR